MPRDQARTTNRESNIAVFDLFFFAFCILHFAFCAVKSSFLFTLLFSILLKTQALEKSRRKCAPFVAPCLSTVYQILPRYLVTKATDRFGEIPFRTQCKLHLR